MISRNWRHMLSFLESELSGTPGTDGYLKLFSLYFSLIDDGNVYMSLDRDLLKKKAGEKLDALRVRFSENGGENDETISSIKNDLFTLIDGMQDPDFGLAGLPVTGEKKLFTVDGHRLFTRKNFEAKTRVCTSVNRLFSEESSVDGINVSTSPVIKKGFGLSAGQQEVIEKGYKRNLAVTGGPGTGKTTSILFLLIELLRNDQDVRNVFLTAPSGKAAARMKESIDGNLKNVSDEFCSSHRDIIEKIKGLESYTVHRLLGIDRDTGDFSYNRDNKFPEKSIFIIDEASMIDISVFASLLEAMPDDARVFILGDKDQLPSVECGAVFGEILGHLGDDFKVGLTESKRFGEDSSIYRLAKAVNGDDEELPVTNECWKPLSDFKIAEPVRDSDGKVINNIYYFDGVKDFKSAVLGDIVCNWYEKYHAGLKEMCAELNQEDADKFTEIIGMAESARILCADNESVRGVNHINDVILKKYFSGRKKIAGFHVGELIMVTKNNNPIELYNGDSGVVVSFAKDENSQKKDDTLYAMFRKNPTKKLKIERGKKLDNKIFQLGDYTFYPLSLINSDEIVPAFAITIHKSQGSDYDNIMVILPKLKGHPLLNRQIVYTAITRTKGDTYILSNQENLVFSQNSVITRDTGVFS